MKHLLLTGKLPEKHCSGHFAPIYKGGLKNEPANYRTLALTNHATKTFQSILKKNEIMNRTQHGFRQSKSTISQLLTFYKDIITKLVNGDHVDGIYLHFSKAFKKVDLQNPSTTDKSCQYHFKIYSMARNISEKQATESKSTKKPLSLGMGIIRGLQRISTRPPSVPHSNDSQKPRNKRR